MGGRSAILVVILAGGGCARGPLFLEVVEGSQSALVIRQRTKTSLWGVDLSGSKTFQEAIEPGRATVLFFPDPIEALQLGPGEIVSPGPGESARVIPVERATAFWTNVFEDGFDDWRPFDPNDPSVVELRLPAIDRSRCWKHQGCVDWSVPICDISCAPRGIEAPDEPALPVAPEPPVDPSFVEQTTGVCPPGTRPSNVGGTEVCEPLARSDLGSCTGDEELFFSGCGAVSGPCPASEFAESIPGAIYVSPNGIDGAPADGSMSAPFQTLRYASTVASSGSTIVLAKGTHAAGVDFDHDVEIHGACVSETILEGNVTVTNGASATFSRFSIQTSSSIGLYVNNGSRVDAAEMVIDSASDAAVAIAESDVTIRRAVLRGAEQEEALAIWRASVDIRDVAIVRGRIGIGVDDDLARLSGDEIVVIGTSSIAMYLHGGARADLSNVFMVGDPIGVLLTQGAHLDLLGATVLANGPVPTSPFLIVDSSIQVSRTVIDGPSEWAFYLDRSSGGIDDAVLANVSGYGLVLTDADLVVSRIRVSDAWRGIQVNRDSLLTLTDAVVRDTEETGLVVSDGVLRLERCMIDRATRHALLVDDKSEGDVDDLTVGSVRRAEDGTAIGLLVGGGSVLNSSRVRVDTTRDAIVVLDDSITRLEDVTVFGASAAAFSSRGGDTEVQRLHVENAQTALFVVGIDVLASVRIGDFTALNLSGPEIAVVRENSTLDVTRASVSGHAEAVGFTVGRSDTSVRPRLGLSHAWISEIDRGVVVGEGVEGSVHHVQIEGSSRAALYVHPSGTLTATAVRLGPGSGFGQGYGVYSEGTATLSDFEVFEQRFGVSSAEPGSVVLDHGVIRNNETAIQASGCRAPVNLSNVQILNNRKDLEGTFCEAASGSD